MEQATNTFNKGLQLDTHPIVQGNDTLSDCLNGTLITMNGNEVVLQNDMGNRRVDNAYLPAGYEPVGIKEYGGIIYVAAYNPITNMSQIGSFPSPERKFGIEYEDLGGQIQFSNLRESVVSSDQYWKEYVDNRPNSKETIKYLKQDSILIPLTSDTSLHPGDKFTVYSSYILNNEYNPQITNLNNIIGDKVTSPKNKLYTLQLGILNSQNQFVDVTESLERWNTSNGTILDTSNNSKLIKFNTGYFIAPSFDTSLIDNLSNTINDGTFIQERNKIALNTYAYKLVGPLYLKAMLNHVKSVKYFISGKNDEENNKAILKIRASLEYNCPDGLSGGSGDNEYNTYNTSGTSKLNFVFFEQDISPKNISISGRDKTTYNKINNLYYVDITKEYEIDTEITSNNTTTNKTIIKGLLTIPSMYDDYSVTNNNQTYNYNNDGKGIYVKELSQKIEIDINDLGTSVIKAHTWKFSIKNNILNYGFNAFSEPDVHFKSLQMYLVEIGKTFVINNIRYKIDTNGNIITYNGDNSHDVSLNSDGWIKLSSIDIPYMGSIPVSDITSITPNYDKRKLYNVIFMYWYGNDGPILCKKAQWFLGTGLFDDYYNYKQDFNEITTYDIIPDFTDTVGEIFIEKTSEESTPFEGKYYSFTDTQASSTKLKHKITYNIKPVSSPYINLNDYKCPEHIQPLLNNYRAKYSMTSTSTINNPILDTEIIKKGDINIADSDIYERNGSELNINLVYAANLITNHGVKPIKLFKNISEYIDTYFYDLIANTGFEIYDDSPGKLRIYGDSIKTGSNDSKYIKREGHDTISSEEILTCPYEYTSYGAIVVNSYAKFFDNGSENQTLYNAINSTFNNFICVQYSFDYFKHIPNDSNPGRKVINVWIKANSQNWVLFDQILENDSAEDDTNNANDTIYLSGDNGLKSKIISSLENLSLYIPFDNQALNFGTFIDHSTASYTENISFRVPVTFNYTITKSSTSSSTETNNGNRITFSIKEAIESSTGSTTFSKTKTSKTITINSNNFEEYIIRTLTNFPYCFIHNNTVLDVVEIIGPNNIGDALLYYLKSTVNGVPSTYEAYEKSSNRRTGVSDLEAKIPTLQYTTSLNPSLTPYYRYQIDETYGTGLDYGNVRFIPRVHMEDYEIK